MRRAAILLLALIAVLSCDREDSRSEKLNGLVGNYVSPPQQKLIGSEGSGLAMDLVRTLACRENGNFLVSPYALRMSLAMAECAADGAARRAIHDAAGFGGFSIEEICGYFHSAQHKICNTSAYAPVQVGTSLWTDRRLKCNQLYFKTMKSIFYVECATFEDRGNIAATINEWAGRSTDPKVEIFTEGTENIQGPVWAGAFAYNADLTQDNAFNAATMHEDFFYSSRGGVVTVRKGRFITARLSNVKLYRGGGFLALPLECCGGSMTLHVLLPVGNVGVEDMMSWLDADRWHEVTEGNYTSNVDVTLPEFTASYSADAQDVADVFRSRGMAAAFDGKADFSILSSSVVSVGAFVSGAAFGIRAGNEKPSALAMEDARAVGAKSSDVLEFKVDHPFAYFLVDKNTGAILLAGVQRII